MTTGATLSNISQWQSYLDKEDLTDSDLYAMQQIHNEIVATDPALNTVTTDDIVDSETGEDFTNLSLDEINDLILDTDYRNSLSPEEVTLLFEARYRIKLRDEASRNPDIAASDSISQINTSSIIPPNASVSSATAGVVHGIDENWKRCNNPNNDNYYIEEIRPPYLRRTPNEKPIIIDMIDSNNKEILIELQDNTIITALKMAPNPETLSINSNKIINRYNTMTRWVEEHWGDNMDVITFSGSTYSFCAMTAAGAYSGLTLARRNSSVAFKYLKSLVTFFRTNGCLYQESNVYALKNPNDVDNLDYEYDVVNDYIYRNVKARGSHPRQGMLRERLYIRMQFDFATFIGYFESFDITESSASPFRLTYNLSFKSEKTIWNNSL